MADLALNYGTVLATAEDRLAEFDADVVLIHMALARLGHMMQQDLQELLRKDGLQVSEYQVLAALWMNGVDQPIPPVQLSRLILQTSGGMTKTLRRLENAGLVRRTLDTQSGNQLVHLTRSGEKRIERHLRRRLSNWNDRLQCHTKVNGRLAETLWALIEQP